MVKDGSSGRLKARSKDPWYGASDIKIDFKDEMVMKERK